ncbi:ABC transporter permease [Oceanibium sediminis]|uniref:ABC transporter permease n=1 Tax=Oceanibium sediminis TaxID=2026339 RepID=UPI000DD4DFDA|nr:MlaE family lipid ABC transporter permease subunit [Oceanibium sediminis]
MQFDATGDGGQLSLSGALTVHDVTRLHQQLSSIAGTGQVTADLGAVSHIDTAGAWALSTFEQRLSAAGGALHVANASDNALQVLKSVRDAMPKPETPPRQRMDLRAFLEATGRAVVKGVSFALELTGYLGMFFSSLGRILVNPRKFPLTSLVAHSEDVGFRAVPIVALMAFLIGVVLAFQGSAQLRQFGAEVFVVDLIAISVLRELGILLTAIIVAGRTASAFTAAIGSMKMREEIDAMRTLGLDPAMVLFLPRILALLLMLPILGLIANVSGLLGGALMSWLELGISPSMFRIRLIEGTDISHVFVGLIKAPVFALVIGVVGCHAGMQVRGTAESLGRMTSNAVVTAIFAVIVVDAFFSIFFAELGI